MRYFHVCDSKQLEKNIRKGGVDIIIGRKWLYSAMALTGGFLGGVAAMEFAPAVAMEAHQTRMLRAEQFELVDNSGSRRAVPKVTTRGMADLMMLDGSGRDRAEFRVAQDGGASVGFYDENGSRRVLVGEASQGRDGLAIYGSNGRQLATLTATPDNQANLTLYDSNTGRPRGTRSGRKRLSRACSVRSKRERSRRTEYQFQGQTWSRSRR
jgi:hypothetical protein